MPPRSHRIPASARPRRRQSLVTIEAVESRRLMAASFFVSPVGSDLNAGTSPDIPWRSIGRVNGQDLGPGDSVFFEGGATFEGALRLDADDSGTPEQPVVVGSYGDGRATIRSGVATAVGVYNTGGLVVRDLVLAGDGVGFNAVDGVQVFTDRAGDDRPGHVRLENLDVSGYGGWGVSVGGWAGPGAGWRDVRVTHAALHDNGRGGLVTYAEAGKPNEQVYVGHVRAYSNHGTSSATERSGDGILLANVDGATVEHSVAHDNGALNFNPSNGPVGIWAYESNAVVLQFNESFDNRTGSNADGGGFDFDGGVTNSVMQYNYAHGNDGPGFLLYQFKGSSPWANNTVRYNISVDDARKNTYGGVFVGGGVSGAAVYNNTVSVSQPAGGAVVAAAKTMAGADVLFANNVLVAAGGARVVDDGSGGAARFRNNAYWSHELPPQILVGTTLFRSLDEWRGATGQETLDGSPLGMIADPGFVGTGPGPEAMKIDPRSPLRDAGIDLAGIIDGAPGDRDFFGGPLPEGGAYDVGAHEVVAEALRLVGADVGAVSRAGSTAHNADTGTYRLSGSGVDADAFHFAHASVGESGSLTAAVPPRLVRGRFGEAGLMVRAGLEPDAAFVSVSVSPTLGLVVQSRVVRGGSVTTTRTLARAPVALRLEWSGGVAAASYSTDGSTWRRVRTPKPLYIEATAVAGLFVRSRSEDSLATAVFSKVVLANS